MPKRSAKAMWMEDKRAASFDDAPEWPFTTKRSKCHPTKMAKAGFFATGDGDNVTCFMCSKSLDGWEKGDDPVKEHKKHSPACAFMNLHLEANRLKTFKHWPHKRFKHKPKEFARAGFWFCPSEGSPDMVQCISCNKQLDGWECDDDPMEEHRAHTKKCAFLDAIVEQPVTIVAIKETVELAPAPFEPEPEPEPAAATEVVVEDAATGPEQVQGAQPGAVTSAPEIKAAAVSAPQEAAAGRPAAAEEDGAALSPVCDDVDPSMTVEQYLRKLNETQIQTFVFACEQRLSAFRTEAAVVREQIACM